MKTTATFQLRDSHAAVLAATGNRSSALNALIPRITREALPRFLAKRLTRPGDSSPAKARSFCLDPDVLMHLQALAYAAGLSRDEVLRLALEAEQDDLDPNPNPNLDPNTGPRPVIPAAPAIMCENQ